MDYSYRWLNRVTRYSPSAVRMSEGEEAPDVEVDDEDEDDYGIQW